MTANQKDPCKIHVNASVDQYAASGGYMIASQADYLIAAPFATLGSVGVMLKAFNFHEAAKRYGVTPSVLKAGSAKNPITTWGPVTQNEMDTEMTRLEKVHLSFQEFVLNGRPQLKQQNKKS
jgi:serine protease SohB